MFKNLLIKWLTKDVDLIYTSKGNVPVTSLETRQEWSFTEGQIQFREYSILNGEIVKDGAHIYKMPQGTELYIKQGNL